MSHYDCSKNQKKVYKDVHGKNEFLRNSKIIIWNLPEERELHLLSFVTYL